VESIFERLNAARGQVKPEVAQLETQIKNFLAQQKEYLVKIDQLETKNDTLSEQLDTTTLKVIKAERKLDRTKSAQVHKLEQQALASATTQVASTQENGSAKETNEDYVVLKTKYGETVAVMAKQKEQIESLLSEMKGLQDENAMYKVKKESITDEDYARTEVFKQFKTQNEDLIKRINNLEAINKQLREEAEKLQAERTAFKTQLETEAQLMTSDLEEQVQRMDSDLARIRHARDELHAEKEVRKASQEQEKVAAAQMKDLIELNEDRIAVLENELSRLRPNEDVTMSTPREDLESLSEDALRQKVQQLERDYEAIQKEIPGLEKAYKKSLSVVHNKVMDFTALEERVAMLTAEKNKADQKYFASRRDIDFTKTENRTLRLQNAKSSETIAQLKAVETQSRSLITTMEKQLSNLRQSNTSIAADNKKLESTASDANRRAEAVKTQISDLTNLVKSKDATMLSVKEDKMSFEREVEKLSARVTQITSDRDSWKEKTKRNSSEEEDMLRVSSSPLPPCFDDSC
jgi:E3 ubiquitin-protein ligase BRE1